MASAEQETKQVGEVEDDGGLNSTVREGLSGRGGQLSRGLSRPQQSPKPDAVLTADYSQFALLKICPAFLPR